MFATIINSVGSLSCMVLSYMSFVNGEEFATEAFVIGSGCFTVFAALGLFSLIGNKIAEIKERSFYEGVASVYDDEDGFINKPTKDGSPKDCGYLVCGRPSIDGR